MTGIFGIVIHGGAGLDRSEPDARAARIEAMLEAVEAGHAILRTGGTALDAATAAVLVLEDCPLFNAGRGSVLNAAGEIEMDASLMDGDGRCGAVAGVRTLRNPVLGARAVLHHSEHALLAGAGAERFAIAHGVAVEAADYFRTPERIAALEKKRNAQSAPGGLGTVGAVALDRTGGLAAATSTGGTTGKWPGRIGDSAIAGAGTWAENGLIALSCTGTGDIFLRQGTARDIACRIAYRQEAAGDALRHALENVAAAGGEGGAIGILPDGQIAVEWNTPMMNRAWRIADGAPFAATE